MVQKIFNILAPIAKGVSPRLVPVCRSCIEGMPCAHEVHGVTCQSTAPIASLAGAIEQFRRHPQVIRELLK